MPLLARDHSLVSSWLLSSLRGASRWPVRRWRPPAPSRSRAAAATPEQQRERAFRRGDAGADARRERRRGGGRRAGRRGPPPVDAGVGHVVFRHPDGHWRRVAATPGASLEDIGAALDAISPGQDNAASLSLDGRFLALDTGRLACARGDCLGVATLDDASVALVAPSGDAAAASGSPDDRGRRRARRVPALERRSRRSLRRHPHRERLERRGAAHRDVAVPVPPRRRVLVGRHEGGLRLRPLAVPGPRRRASARRQTDGSALRKVLCPADAAGRDGGQRAPSPRVFARRHDRLRGRLEQTTRRCGA